MGKLIILRGNSGSGKTTVAWMLQEKFGPNTIPGCDIPGKRLCRCN